MDIKRIVFYLSAALWFLAVTTTLPAWAAESSKTVSLDDYIQTALEHSPESAEILADSKRREADADETEQLLNPDLQIDVTAVQRNSGRQVNIELEQPLRGSDFGKRQSYASVIRSTRNIEQKAKFIDLSHEAARAYMDLWLAQQRIALLDRVIADAKRQAKTVNTASAQGLADKAEADIFSTEASELELQKSALIAEKKTFANAFIRLAGMPMADYRLAAPRPRQLPVSEDDLVRMAESETSVRSILAGRRDVAERRLAVAHTDTAIPQFAPRAVLNRDFTNDTSNFMLGVRVNIPVWSQNQPEVLRARADYESTDRALKALDENDFRSVLRNAWQAAKDGAATADKYQTSIAPSWKNIEALTEKKLASGQASVFDLWQVQNRVLDAETKNLEARQKALESVLTLENLAGVVFTSVSASDKKGD